MGFIKDVLTIILEDEYNKNSKIKKRGRTLYEIKKGIKYG